MDIQQPSTHFNTPTQVHWLKSAAAIIMVSVVTFLFILLPDVLFRKIQGIQPFVFETKETIPIAIIALALTLTCHDGIRKFFIICTTLCLIIWFGVYSYFGDVIRPAQIFLAFDQSEEIGRAINSSELFPMLPGALIALGCGIGIWKIQNRGLRKFLPKQPVGTVFLCLIICVLYGRALFHSHVSVVFPSSTMTGFIGSVNAISTSVRLKFLEPHHPLPDGLITKQLSSTPLASNRPLTVAVIIGESVNPRRMSLFDQTRDTTPKLLARAQNSSDFKLFSKIGFSSGVSTLASVPSFLQAAYVGGHRNSSEINLARIAQSQGFNVSLVSTQRIKSLQLADVVRHASFTHTEKFSTAVQRDMGDHLISKILKSHTLVGSKNFFVIHQRSNHAPYLDSCKGASSQHVPEPNTPLSRMEEYDIGLKCYDQQTDEILQHFSKIPGDVFVFLTADHNELMGENGIWGHHHANVLTALVPTALFTNNPDHPITAAYNRFTMPTAYEIAQLVSRSMGVVVAAEAYDDRTFYISSGSKSSKGGTMRVTRLGDQNFSVEHLMNLEKVVSVEQVSIELPFLDIVKNGHER